MSPESVQVLEHYGIIALPLLVVAEQFGIPLPAVPLLLGFGALAARGRGSIPLTLGMLTAVALAVDFAWYELGRRRGAQVLSRLCRLSLEPDSCVRRAENMFRRFGVRTMLVAKFVPGLTTILPPLAGMFEVGRVRFALYELGGVLLWAGMWMGLGYVFSDAVALIAARVAALGLDIALALGVGLGGYILVTYLRRRLSFRRLRNVPLSPEELKRRLDAGEDITIIDLRTPLEVAAMPYAIPGSHLDCRRRDRRVPIADPSGSPIVGLLLLTQPGHERPGGAPARAQGDDPGPPAAGRVGGLEGAELSC